MKTLTSLLTAAVLFSGVMVLAQGQNGRRQHRSEFAERMKSRLSLTEEQYASIKKADESYRSKIETMRQDNKTDQQLKRTELRNLRQQRREEIGKILTAEQKAEWRKITDEKRNQKGTRNQEQNERIDDLRKSLSLNDEQVTKIKQLHYERSKEIRSEKVDGQSKEQTKEARKVSREKYHTAMKSILTPEQFTKWQLLLNEKQQSLKKKRESNNHRR